MKNAASNRSKDKSYVDLSKFLERLLDNFFVL